ncbi:MAG: urea transporter [Sulfurimonas sp.]|nr:urea transporter [Sulfurimonas sp.]MDQ7061008.1 urea transporter [Sulfurimonas sp.]
MNELKLIMNNILKPYSSILFLNNKYAGLFLLLVTFINPSVAISGIISIVFAILFAEIIGLKEAFLAQGFYVYNSLLVGMGIGFIFMPSFLSVLLIAIASSLTLMLSFMLNRLFVGYKIPILSLPFSIVTIFVYLASLKYSNLLSSLVNNANIYDIDLPLIISAFLKSFGTIFFLPNNIAGLMMILLVLYFSRITVVMALVGFYFGVYIHSILIGSFTLALYDPYAFNYILVAIALCGVFLLPTLKNFLLALIGVSISVVLTDSIGMLFNYYAIPVFTMPFNITVITFIFTLSIIAYKEFNLEIKATPELSLSNYLSKYFRFATTSPKISLPFTGQWSVYQVFDDEWTHKGKYKYAYDFVKQKENKNYKNDGLFKEDYYAYGESVVAPVSGYIVDLRSDLVDNDIAVVDRVNNWGNYIIIKSDDGLFVEISHLMQASLLFHIGEYVQVNTIIAKCGNSGYSPEPHIHIQVQELGLIGSFTRFFLFSEYIIDKTLVLNNSPKKNESILATISNKEISSKFLFILDDTFTYEVFEDEKSIDTVEFKVKMDESGEFYLCDKHNNKLYFYNDLKQFYFYNYIGGSSYLKELFILVPRVPFVSGQKITFTDYLPTYLVNSKLKTLLIELISTIKKDVYKQSCEYTFDGLRMSSKYGTVSMEHFHKGPTEIRYNNTKLRRVK